jgi:RNA polymerase sigma factor (sigma-70 family)
LGKPFKSDSDYHSVGRNEQLEFRELFYDAFTKGYATQEDCGSFIEQLYKKFGREIFLFIYQQLRKGDQQKRIRSPYGDAEDFCQETFLKAFEWLINSIGQKIEKLNERAWLYRIASNLIIDKLWKPSKPIIISIFSEEGEVICIPDSGRDPLRVLINNELMEKLLQCLEELSEVRRGALQMVDLDGFSETEAANNMNIKVDTLRKRLFDARRQLRNCLKLYFINP